MGLPSFCLCCRGRVFLGLEEVFGLYGNNMPLFWWQNYLDEVLSASVMLYVIWMLLHENVTQHSKGIVGAALMATSLLCVASIEAQGITVGMVIILLGFSRSNTLLLGLGICSELFYLSFYYYQLDLSLLEKAQTLFILGVVLLIIRWFLLRITASKNGGDHA